MHRSTVSLAQSPPSFMTGSILDLWLCFLLFYIGSSLNGTQGKRGEHILIVPGWTSVGIKITDCDAECAIFC